MNRLVFAYVTVTVALGFVFLTQLPVEVPPVTSGFWNAFVAFLGLALAAEAAFLRLPATNATSSVAFIPYLAALHVLGPFWTVVIAVVTEIGVETFVRKKPAVKVVFNTANHALALGLAGVLFQSLGGSFSLEKFDLAVLAFTAATGAYFLVNAGGTAVAIALSSGKSLRESWERLVGGSLVFDLLASPLALLLAFLYVKAQLVGLVVVIVPLFLVRHIHSINLKLEEVNRDLLELMVKAIEARDPYTSGHSLRVSRISGLLARELALPPRQVERIETAALLHDVGKIHEEYAPVLRKAGKLSAEEGALMRTHAIRSYELVQTISSFRGSVDLIVRHHHENFDGTGYPDGLVEDDIPLGARVIMVADTADAMTTDRPYRKALHYDQVKAELVSLKGRQFDPQVVDAFCRSGLVRQLLSRRGRPEVPSSSLELIKAGAQ